MPGAGFEPARPKAEDFKSPVSADSTTRALKSPKMPIWSGGCGAPEAFEGVQSKWEGEWRVG